MWRERSRTKTLLRAAGSSPWTQFVADNQNHPDAAFALTDETI